MLRHRKNKRLRGCWDGGCRTRVGVYMCVGVTDIARKYINGGTTVDGPTPPNAILTYAFSCMKLSLQEKT